ncbi:MAG: 4Fe-4S cluster-binding domain-containing protein [Candidatus Bathycorpusculaceae bacterium]
MNKLHIPEPISGGIMLSYKCTSECKHCMYACSPCWKADWISQNDLEEILSQLADKIYPSPFGPDEIGINYGLHFTGGEPLLNFDLLLKTTEMSNEHGIPSTFVETSCFWCIDDKTTKEKLKQLKEAGLHGILISVNPFILEHVPFERTERAIRISREVFGRNVIVYQQSFYHQFRKWDLKGTLPFEEYLQKAGRESLYQIELLPMGRAAYALGNFYRKYPAKSFFGNSCREELTRDWHIHIDNYCNYMPGYCGGISLGDARNLDSIHEIDLDEKPVLGALVTDLKKLYEFGFEEFGYVELSEGYISKCHLCVDIRKHLVRQTDEIKELRPREFYHHLDPSEADMHET